MKKDPFLRSLVNNIIEKLEEKDLEIVDYWDADLCAIGLKKKGESKRLVYVSSYGESPEYFCLEFEEIDRCSFQVVNRYENVHETDILEKVAEFF